MKVGYIFIYKPLLALIQVSEDLVVALTNITFKVERIIPAADVNIDFLIRDSLRTCLENKFDFFDFQKIISESSRSTDTTSTPIDSITVLRYQKIFSNMIIILSNVLCHIIIYY